MRKSFIGLLSLFILISISSNVSGYRLYNHVISGFVVDENSDAIVGATVTIEVGEKTLITETMEQGYYEIDISGMSIRGYYPGDKIFGTATKGDVEIKAEGILAIDGESTKLDFTASPSDPTVLFIVIFIIVIIVVMIFIIILIKARNRESMGMRRF